ncbi:MAG: DnaJ domain-containing protein [Myxococcota bacterium]|nr:DnaJ domain-containing protein [Myxococcota bacterium]
MNYQVDYYQILGINRTATAEEIKKRFRELARECHPDRAGDSEEMAARFAEIREAYELLIDPVKRNLYDNPPKPRSTSRKIHRKTWKPPSGMRRSSQRTSKKAWKDPANQINLDDILKQGAETGRLKRKPSRLNQQTYRRENAQPGTDIYMKVDLPSNIAHMGGSVTIEYKRLVRGEDLALVQIDEIQQLRVAENTQYGDTLRIPKLGNAGPNGGVYGDLVCEVIISGPQPRSHTPTSQDPEVQSLPISISEAILGGRVEVETPAGKCTISIPPYSSSGQRLRLRGKGQGGADFLLELKIIVPKILDAESIALIQKFAALNPKSPR